MILVDNGTISGINENEWDSFSNKLVLYPHPSGGTHDHMFSEGADNKASKGFLDLLGGFYIVVPYIDHTTQKTEIKSLEPETSSSPELAHIFM